MIKAHTATSNIMGTITSHGPNVITMAFPVHLVSKTVSSSLLSGIQAVQLCRQLGSCYPYNADNILDIHNILLISWDQACQTGYLQAIYHWLLEHGRVLHSIPQCILCGLLYNEAGFNQTQYVCSGGEWVKWVHMH